MKVKHYVTYYYPGAFVPEEDTKEVEEGFDPTTAVMPSRSITGFTTFERVFEEIEYKGEKVTLSSKDLNCQSRHIGTFLSVDDVKEKYGEDSIAYGNVVGNEWLGARLTPRGSLLPVRNEKERAEIVDPSTLKYKGEDEAE